MDATVVRDAAAMEELFRGVLRKKERVLICFPGEDNSPGRLLCHAAALCGAVPLALEEDCRWITLLQLGFSRRCSCLVGEAEVLLGLCKLARRMGTPLYARSCIVVGSQPDAWLAGTLETGLDCTVRGWICPEPPPEPSVPALEQLKRELWRWSSILDFRLEKNEFGLNLEMVTFPGERLPKLPSLAGRQLRQWNPKEDCPFSFRDIPYYAYRF